MKPLKLTPFCRHAPEIPTYLSKYSTFKNVSSKLEFFPHFSSGRSLLILVFNMRRFFSVKVLVSSPLHVPSDLGSDNIATSCGCLVGSDILLRCKPPFYTTSSSNSSKESYKDQLIAQFYSRFDRFRNGGQAMVFPHNTSIKSPTYK